MFVLTYERDIILIKILSTFSTRSHKRLRLVAIKTEAKRNSTESDCFEEAHFITSLLRLSAISISFANNNTKFHKLESYMYVY
jgi:hypothetical protein